MSSGAGPYIPYDPIPQANTPVSPVELLKQLLDLDLNRDVVPAGAIVGPASNDMQQQGCASLTSAGNASIDRYSPCINARIQIRCMAHSMARAEQIGMHIYQLLHVRHREVVTQASTGDKYLIHRTAVLAGPSNHFDSVSTWESLLFIELMTSQYPVP